MNRRWRRAATVALVATVAIVVQAGPRPFVIAAGEVTVQAPARLSETGLYVPGRVSIVDQRNRPFTPQYPLWSDGAVKRRWVFLPPGTTIDIRDDAAWEFPIGTRFWKEFSFDGRKVETRMLWKATAAQWVTVSYLWNDAQTDAMLASDRGEPSVASLGPNRRHSVPSANDCLSCHGVKRTEPLGFNPLQLSTDRDPTAIHGEALAPGALTLRTLVDQRLVSPTRTDLLDAPPRIRSTSAQTRSMLGYLAANCGSCHRGDGEIASQMPSLKHSDLRDGDAVAVSLVGRGTVWQVPGVREGASVLIDHGTPDASAMLRRMRSRSPSSQMPPLGTVLRDEKAIDALAKWISGDLAALVQIRRPEHAAR